MSSVTIPPLPSKHRGLLTPHRWLIAILVAVGFAVAAAGIYIFIPSSKPLSPHLPFFGLFLPTPDFPALKAEGDAIFADIERYHTAHGSYPPTLEAAGIARPETRWRHWKYGPRNSSFTLQIGDYSKHGFELSREGSDNGGWWHRDR